MSRAEAENIMSFGDSLDPAEIHEAVHITNGVIGRLTIPEDLEADQRAGDDVARDLVVSFFTAMVPADFNPYDAWFQYLVREDLDRWVAFIGPRLVRDLEEQLGFR